MNEDELAALLRDPDGLEELGRSIGLGDLHEARDWSTANLGRPSPREPGVVGLLRKMSALFANGFRRAGYSVGSKHPPTHAATRARYISILDGAAPTLASCCSRRKGSLWTGHAANLDLTEFLGGFLLHARLFGGRR